MDSIIRNRRASLYIVLSGIFLTNAIIAELTGVKIFSLEKTIGVSPANISILDFVLDFNLTTGVLIWPVVFITTDLINEYFGRHGVKKISILTTVFLLYSFIMIWVATKVSPADFWIDSHKGDGLNIDLAYNKIFGQGLNIILGSATAFLIGQILDAYVYHRVKKYTGSKLIWMRATVSTAVSQLVDSFLVLYIAFHLLTEAGSAWPIAMVFSVGTINYIYKLGSAILLIPVLYAAHYLIEKYLKKDDACQKKTLDTGQQQASEIPEPA